MRGALVSSLLVVASCSVGDDSIGTNSTLDAPALVDASGPRWLDATSGDPTGNGCKPLGTPAGNGQHNPGRNCMDACHAHGFTLAGTLYTTPTSNTGYAGATITFTDANGGVTNLVAAGNGNFYTREAVAFPITVVASACPSLTRMTAAVTSGQCNAGNCHAQAGGPAGQIHLP